MKKLGIILLSLIIFSGVACQKINAKDGSNTENISAYITRTYDAELQVYCYTFINSGISCISAKDLK